MADITPANCSLFLGSEIFNRCFRQPLCKPASNLQATSHGVKTKHKAHSFCTLARTLEPYLPRMGTTQLHFSELKAGRCKVTVMTRLLRFWEARNVKRP
ncbi:hypothetical protein Bca52824_086814 [Brassica carinata]|uniref:Uncharacterized protein n=1 Tax=Brassica carinata TaxID=52824 RepID=A0A8X7TN09_BRACI|nr:hypothetical protein Bca52824_086814 [Brassica carinata]